jgi:hypothetical protein
VIKNEELVNLRGGYDDGGGAGMRNCSCSYSYPNGGSGILPAILVPDTCSSSGCTAECKAVYRSQYPGAIIIGLCKP